MKPNLVLFYCVLIFSVKLCTIDVSNGELILQLERDLYESK